MNIFHKSKKVTSAIARTLKLAFLLMFGIYTEGMLLNWLTLEMLVMELDMID
jgi:hypothetical protein